MSGLLGTLTLYETRLKGSSRAGLASLSLSFSASLSLLLSFPSWHLAGSVALPVPVSVGAFGVRWGVQAVGRVL